MSVHGSHEISSARAHDIMMGSERGFGVVAAVAFALIGVWPAVRVGWRPNFDPDLLRWWSLAVAAGFLAIALAYPFPRVYFDESNHFDAEGHEIVAKLISDMLSKAE